MATKKMKVHPKSLAATMEVYVGKTYCEWCGKELIEVFLHKYSTYTGKLLTDFHCRNMECEVGKKKVCIAMGGHFYPDRPWYQWFFPYDAKYATCTKCGYIY